MKTSAAERGYSDVRGGAKASRWPDFCFQAVTRGTLAEGARVELVRTPGQAWCMNCGETITIGERYDPCPRCGGHELQITGGDEMRVRELEVE